jgi:integrase
MKGSIHFRKDRGYYYVSWVHKGKPYKIYKYNGEYLYHEKLAEKLLACMQADEEGGFFRIEKYTREVPTDVIPYLRSWIKLQEAHLSPATYRDYLNSINNHLIPWFKKHPVNVHEIRYDTLCQLLTDIKREGKGKLNVMYCLRRCLDYAWKSSRIIALPPFPEKRLYGIEPKPIRWISEERQVKIIQAIPEAHQPIFWWLKYHLRRPSEAMALFKEDYDPATDSFIIRRAFSSKKLVEHTKTHKIHFIPCHSEFKPIMETMPKTFGPYFFTNPTGRLKGQHYQHDYLVDLWHKACGKVGEEIDMYAGLKHSSCSQYVNEKGLSIDELQMLTDHARRDSVMQYASVQLEAKRRIMERKVIPLGEIRGKDSGT